MRSSRFKGVTQTFFMMCWLKPKSWNLWLRQWNTSGTKVCWKKSGNKSDHILKRSTNKNHMLSLILITGRPQWKTFTTMKSVSNSISFKVLFTGPRNNWKSRTKYLPWIGSGPKRRLTATLRFWHKILRYSNGGKSSWKSMRKSRWSMESARKVKCRHSKSSKRSLRTRICLMRSGLSWLCGKSTKVTCFISNPSFKTHTGNPIQKNTNYILSHVDSGTSW